MKKIKKRKLEEEKIQIETLKRKLDGLKDREENSMAQSKVLKTTLSKKSIFSKRTPRDSHVPLAKSILNDNPEYKEMKTKDAKIKKMVKQTRKLKNEYLQELAKDSYQKHFLKKLVNVIEDKIKGERKASILVSQKQPIGVEEFIRITSRNDQSGESRKLQRLKILKQLFLDSVLRSN